MREQRLVRTSNANVAVKVNLNSSSIKDGMNLVNVSPQVALAMVRQLVNNAHVPTGNIVIYDARRDIYSGMLTKIWSEFKMFASYRMMGPIRRSL